MNSHELKSAFGVLQSVNIQATGQEVDLLHKICKYYSQTAPDDISCFDGFGSPICSAPSI